MSMNATDSVLSACATFRATVDFPDPDPPAMPMMSGFTCWRARVSAVNSRGGASRREAVTVSRYGIGWFHSVVILNGTSFEYASSPADCRQYAWCVCGLRG